MKRKLKRFHWLVFPILIGLGIAAAWADTAKAVEVIVDDQSAGFSKYGTSSYWKEASIGYGSHMFYTYNGQSVINNYAIWQPNLSGAGAGTYAVSVYIPNNCADTTNATYTVFHNGATDTRTINQANYSNEWVSLGNFYFSAGGSEYVKLVDKTGETETTKRVGFDAVKWVKINQPPTASLSASPLSGTAPLAVTFTMSASDPDGSIAAWSLGYGDGNSDSGMGNPPSTKTYTYASGGTYIAALGVSDNNGGIAGDAEIITVNQLPTCSISSNPGSGNAPLTVTFSLSASDSDGSITGWVLDVNGDGNADYSGIGAPPSTKTHTYTSAGTYNIIFMVRDDKAAPSSPALDTVTVNQPPTCSLSANPTSGKIPLSVTFTMSASDSDGSIAGWVLDVNGDSNADYSGTGVPPSSQTHIYDTAGEYSVVLIVSDNNSATTYANTTITANLPNIAARIDSYTPASLTIVEVGNSTTLSVTFTNTGDTEWKFIAGASVWDSAGNLVADYEKTLDTALQPDSQTTVSWTHTVNTAGDYKVQFGVWKAKPYISENLLDKDPSPSQVLIFGNQPPTCSISSSPNSGAVPLTVTFSLSANDSDGSVAGWVLDVNGDGNADYSGIGAPPSTKTHTYTSGGTYNIIFIVKDDKETPSLPALDTVTVDAPNRPPGSPTNLIQFKPDSTTQIPVGSTVSDQSLIFKGYLSDPDGDKVKLQIELRRVDEYAGSFQNRFTQEGNLINSDNQADTAAYGLINGNYHWQARTMDEHGLSSDWVGFGSNPDSDVDFSISVNSLPFATFTYLPEYPEINIQLTFDAASSYDPDGGTVSYEWEFGDNTTAEGILVTHAYLATGCYTVTLTVRDDEGTQDTYSTTITVFSKALEETINKIVDEANGTLNDIKYNAMDVGSAADFFAEEVTEDENKMVVSSIFQAIDILDYFGFIPLLQVHRVSAFSIGDYSRIVGKYPQLAPLIDIIDDYGWVTAYIAKEQLSTLTEKVAEDGMNELISSNYSYNNAFVPDLVTKINNKKNNLNNFKSEVLDSIGSLTQQEIDFYQKDLQKRLSANKVLGVTYSSKALLPTTFWEIKIAVEGDWKFILGNELYKVSKPLVTLGGPAWFSIPAKVAGTLIAPLIDQFYNQRSQLSSDGETLFYGAEVLSDGFTQSDLISRNTYQGLKNIKDKTACSAPEGSIASIENFAVGPLYGVIGPDKIYYNEIPLFAKKIYSEVKIENASDAKIAYILSVQYIQPFKIGTAIPGIVHKYELPYITTLQEEIEPGQSKTFTVCYKDKSYGGGSSPENYDIYFTLFGITNNGIYLLDTDSTRYGTTKIVTNDVDVSDEELEKAPVFAYPALSEVIPLSAGNYQLNIYVDNPFDFSFPAELTQEIPANIEIISAEGGSISTGSVLWQFEAKPQERRKLVVIFRLKENPQVIEISPAILKIYDQINIDWHIFPSNGVIVEPDICSIPESSRAQGEDYNDWIEPFNAYNSDNLYAYHPNTSPDGVGVELSWNGGISYTSAGKTALFNESEETYILGASNDTWGRIWSSSELNNANFRLRIDDGVSYQDYYNFDFDLPSGAIIRGIEVPLEGYCDAANDYVDQLKVKVYADYIYIPPSSPVAYFTASPKTGKSPLTVQFSNESVGEITNYLWDFGDGSSSSSESPSHTYDDIGTYTVRLTASWPGGSDEIIKTDYITVEADITVSPGESIQDAVNNSSDGDIIYVREGSYVENINAEGKTNLWIKGEDILGTVIRGSISCTDSDISVEHMSILYDEGEELTYSNEYYSNLCIMKDAGVTAVNSNITVKDCLIMPDPDIFGMAKFGKGIQIWNLYRNPAIVPIIENCEILRADTGIYLYSQVFGGAILGEIKNNTLDNNNYGIILRMHKEKPLIQDNTITVSTNGIHITYEDGTLLAERLGNITGNAFTDNKYDIWCDELGE